MNRRLIAPCGMNCGICKAYLRDKNKCPGCRDRNEGKAKSVRNCIIINCDEIKKNNFEFCFECSNKPCKRLLSLDKRYRTKYHMSMLENQDYIKKHGIEQFLEKERKRWECPKCKGIITCHGGMCLTCGYVKFKNTDK